MVCPLQSTLSKSEGYGLSTGVNSRESMTEVISVD